MKTLFTLLLLLAQLMARAESYCNVAIIRDPDGYTNVRELESRQAPIVRRLHQNEVFWFDLEKYRGQQEWIPVWVPQDDFSRSTEPHIQGYVHRSRLQSLATLPAYRGAAFRFRYDLIPFNKKAHVIDRSAGWVQITDVPYAWGVDGTMPKTEIRAIRATVRGRRLAIPGRLLAGLFECTNSFDVYRQGATYFVHQNNSDGAGAYTVVWVLTRHGLHQRLVGTII